MTEPNDQPPALTVDQLNRLRSAGRQEQYSARDKIMSQGERSDSAIVIDEGKVKVTALAENGYETVLALRGPGNLIGEFGCLDGIPRPASVIALTPVTVTRIPSSKFLSLINDDADILYTLLEVTVARMRESDQLRLEFGAYKGIDLAFRGLLALVEQHGVPAGDGRAVILEMYQQDVARYAGVSRETMVRASRLLSASLIIRTEQGKITVFDIEMLRALVARGPR